MSIIAAAGPLIGFAVQEFIAWRERKGRDTAAKPTQAEIDEFLKDIEESTPAAILEEARQNVPVDQHRPPPPES